MGDFWQHEAKREYTNYTKSVVCVVYILSLPKIKTMFGKKETPLVNLPTKYKLTQEVFVFTKNYIGKSVIIGINNFTGRREPPRNMSEEEQEEYNMHLSEDFNPKYYLQGNVLPYREEELFASHGELLESLKNNIVDFTEEDPLNGKVIL